MAHRPILSRRQFLQAALAGSALTATGALSSAFAQSAQQAQPSSPAAPAPSGSPLPTRRLGRSGAEVSILAVGGHMDILSTDLYEQLWGMGCRYFDQADCYKKGQAERDLGVWLARHPERRKEVFVTTKDHPKGGPRELIAMLDRRLEALQTDYVDLYFLHGINPGEYGPQSFEWPKSAEFKETIEAIKKSGKARLVGFSCHDPQKTRYLQAAAEGGFVDAVLVANSPMWNPVASPRGGADMVMQRLEERDAFQRALDAAHKAGVGLISMKQLRQVHHMPQDIPELKAARLSTYQAVLLATWADERFSAACCAMETMEQFQQNVAAARMAGSPNNPFTAEVRQALFAAAAAAAPKVEEKHGGKAG